MNFISNSESRIADYKKLLEEIGKNKKIFPEDFKNLIRDNKNTEQVWLKKLVDERIYENQGLNPPFFYK